MPELIYENELPPPEEFERALKAALANVNPLDDLLLLSNELFRFEQQYGFSSDDFYRQFQAGLLDDELQHCFEWAVSYEEFVHTKKLVESALMRAAIQTEPAPV